MASPTAEGEGELHIDGKWGTDLHTACKDSETDEEGGRFRGLMGSLVYVW